MGQIKKNIILWGWGAWFVHFKPFKVLFREDSGDLLRYSFLETPMDRGTW